MAIAVVLLFFFFGVQWEEKASLVCDSISCLLITALTSLISNELWFVLFSSGFDSFKNCDLPQIINYQQFIRDRQIPAGIGRVSVNLCHICASHKAYAHDYVRKLKAVAVSLVGPLSGMGWHITSYTASTSAACASSPTDGQIWLRRGRPVCVGLMFVSISLCCCVWGSLEAFDFKFKSLLILLIVFTNFHHFMYPLAQVSFPWPLFRKGPSAVNLTLSQNSHQSADVQRTRESYVKIVRTVPNQFI